MKITHELDPINEFNYELECIETDLYYEIAIRSLMRAPDYFWVVPASSSGKYHPTTSLGLGGLVRHTKSVFKISEELLRHPLYAPFSTEEKDQIRVAILLHDICKQGLGSENEHTVSDHPLLVREGVRPWRDGEPVSEKMEKAWGNICDLLETHMGVWNKDRQGKEILEIPKSEGQLFVHLCDYIASRKSVTVDIYERKSQGGSTPTDWKSAPATSYMEGGRARGQIPFIKTLYADAKRAGINNLPEITITDKDGNIILTKGEATEIIETLKKALGRT